MRYYEATSMIAASPEAVWAVLKDGAMPLGLFRGVRSYDLSKDADGGTAFHIREEYTGPLLGLIWRSMPDLRPSVARFAQGLKHRVESGG